MKSVTKTITLAVCSAALLGIAGAAYAQSTEGSQTPSSNRAEPKFQDGSGLSGESNTTSPAGTPQNSSKDRTPSGSADGSASGSSGSGRMEDDTINGMPRTRTNR